MENDLKRIKEELRKQKKLLQNKKKDTSRYSMEFIVTLITHSFQPKPSESLRTGGKIQSFLEECQEFCENPQKDSKDLKLLQTLREKKKNLDWAELHCILYHLQGKVSRHTT